MLRAWGRALALSPGRRCFTTEQQKLLKSYASRPETSEKLRVLWTEYAKAQHAFTESSQEAQNSKDEAMRELFEASLPSVQAEVETAKTALTEALLGPVLPGCRGVILEVLAQRAGTDGADFTAWLKRMYEGLAQCKGWRTNVVDCDFTRISLPHPLAGGGEGYRHLILQFEGPDAWELLRFERGLHRLTVMSAKGPVQSTDVRVLVFPLVNDVESDPSHQRLYQLSDLRFDTLRSSGPGGQHVNKTESAVRVTHLPTSISVLAQTSRSQADNRRLALEQLEARLLSIHIEAQEEAERAARNAAVRQDRARTYQFHKDRIIEHRLDKTDPLNFCRLSEFSSGDTILPMTLRYLHQQDQKERLDTFFTSNEILPT